MYLLTGDPNITTKRLSCGTGPLAARRGVGHTDCCVITKLKTFLGYNNFNV